ncbi:hypothetical protein NN3_18460 [Nocardia neocaledoniensis NBRC 108232]|nr:hypothetical protein NN3_18460 [Nocardia neocaledoniensis NBRC 108232]
MVGAAEGLIGIQLWHVIREQNRWPFCSYNMFNYRLGDRSSQIRVVLATDSGQIDGPNDPWGLLPLEMFRIDSMFRLVFDGDVPSAVRDSFCRTVLDRLNRHSWPRWDQVRRSLRPPAGGRFVAIAVYLVLVDFTVNNPEDRADVVGTRLLHRYDPDGRLSSSTHDLWHGVTT